MKLERERTPMVDQNERCKHCGRWFKEGAPLAWHIKCAHGPKSSEYQAMFAAKARRQREKGPVQK